MVSDHADRSIESRKHRGHLSSFCLGFSEESVSMNALLKDVHSLILVLGLMEYKSSIEHYKDPTPQRALYTAPTDFFKDAAILQQDPPCSTCDKTDSTSEEIQNTYDARKTTFLARRISLCRRATCHIRECDRTLRIVYSLHQSCTIEQTASCAHYLLR